jgi:hypothetical protein
VLAIVVFLSSFPVVLADLTPDAPRQFDFHALVFPADIAVLATIVVAVRSRVRLPRLPAMAAIVGVTLAAAWIAHPSTRGAETVIRWAGVVAIAAIADRASAVMITGSWAVVESLIALLQKVHGGPIGLDIAGESALSFVHFGRALAPPGTLVHPYLLAGLALMGATLLAGAARGRRTLLLAATVAAAPVGFTYSRTALIALVLVLMCFAAARFPAAVLALALGAGVPALLWSDGWIARAHDSTGATASTTASSSNGLDTARSALMRQSVDLIESSPVTGVGPGRYVTALRERGVDVRESGGVLKPVHNLPLLAAAEGGVAAGVAMVALLIGAGVCAWRGGWIGRALFVAFLPFCLLDHFPYTYPQGLVMMGLWLAALTTAERARRAAPLHNAPRTSPVPART